MEIKNISERASYVDKPGETSIVVIANTDRMKVTNILILLLFWMAGGVVVIWNYFGMTDEKTRIIAIAWIAFWAYFAYIMVKGLLWMWRGREIIKIRNGELRYKKDVNGRGWVKTYNLKSIKDIHPATDQSPSWLNRIGIDYWTTDCDSFRFSSGDREVAMGFKLKEQETRKIIELIRRTMN